MTFVQHFENAQVQDEYCVGTILQHQDIDSKGHAGTIKENLRNVWAEVLREDATDISDSDVFFEIGGDSISALQISTRAEERYGIAIAVEQIFLHPSLEEMAGQSQLIAPENQRGMGYPTPPESVKLPNEEKDNQDPPTGKVSIAHGSDVEDVYPCTSMQASLVAMTDETPNLYVRQLVYRIQPALDMDRFCKAWAATIRANPVLRTRICYSKGEKGYVQIVMDEGVSWVRRSSLHKTLHEDLATPMRSGTPFFRYALVDEGENGRFFVWTVHHALIDGASTVNLLQEVAQRYDQEEVSRRAPFENFVRSTASKEDTDDETKFWQRSLLSLDPTSYPPISQDAEFKTSPTSILKRDFTLPKDSQTLKGLTKSLLLRAAWAILLSSHTGTEDIVFGTIASGRVSSSVHGVSQMTGPTINLLPIALRVDPTQTISDFIAHIKQHAVEMMPFEQTGISRIRKILAEKNSTAADFQSFFVIQPGDLDTQTHSSLDRLHLEYIDHLGKKEQHSYPLVVTLTLSADTVIDGRIEYHESITSTKYVHSLFHQFQAILDQLGDAAPQTSIGSISPLSNEDVDQIREWNRETPPIEEVCYHDLFKKQVYLQPNAEAVCSTNLSLTYGEVDGCSTALAEHLIEAGAKRQSAVAVCFEKSVYTIVAILAVIKAGCVYLPIDPSHPRGRIQEILLAAEVELSLASKIGSYALDGLCKTIVVEDPPLFKFKNPKPELPKVKPSDFCYILFTSGSTGKPKGFKISHSAICTSIFHHGRAFQATERWRILQFCAHTFDISVAEFLTTLAFGGCLCVPSEEERLSDLAGIITTLNVDTLSVVPTVANLISPQETPTLKRIILGGEPNTRETFRRWADHVWLVAAYGPSECSIYSSANFGVSQDTNTSSIGHSIGCTQWIVNPNDHTQLSAIGTVGELVISGATLANGYIDEPELTRAAFLPAPAWMKVIQPEGHFEMIYKTGDLARYNHDGTFHIVGRKDTQVKLKGFRIELGEIENRLMEQRVATAVLASLPKSGPCKDQIVAVLSLERSDLRSHRSSRITPLLEEARVEAEQLLLPLKKHVASKLTSYMVPSVWIVLEEMPLLISGKVDRKGIKTWINDMTPEMYLEVVGSSNNAEVEKMPPVPAGSPADILRGIWSTFIGKPVEMIGMNSTFVSVGGDSIQAIRISLEAKEKGLTVPVRMLLSGTSLGKLAEECATTDVPRITTKDKEDETEWISVKESYEPALGLRLEDHPLVEVEDSYQVPPIQRRIRKSREADPRVFLLSWNMEIFSRNEEPVSLGKFAHAWKRVINKHSVLRTIFLKSPDNSRPEMQVVLRNAEPDIHISKFSATSVVPSLDDVLPSVDECFLPHRTHLYQHGDRYFGHIELDHRLIDGWSFALVKREMLAQYDARDDEPLGDAVLYQHFVASHTKDRIEVDQGHWKSVLSGLQPSLLTLPPLHISSTTSTAVRTIRYLPKISVSKLSRFSASNGITPASVFYAAWALTLESYTRSADVSFEYVVWGRDVGVPGILDLIGPTLNILPFHLRNVEAQEEGDAASALARLAKRIQEQRLEDSTYTACDPREVLEDDMKVALPFNTAVNFQRRPTGVKSETMMVDDRLTDSVDPWHFDCMLRVIHVEDDDTYFVAMEFDEKLFDRERMAQVLDTVHAKVKIAYQ